MGGGLKGGGLLYWGLRGGLYPEAGGKRSWVWMGLGEMMSSMEAALAGTLTPGTRTPGCRGGGRATIGLSSS